MSMPRLKEISGAGAASTESHLLVLTSLVLADEIYDLQDNVKKLSQQKANGNGASNGNGSAEEEQQAVEAINHLALRIDSIAEKLQKI